MRGSGATDERAPSVVVTGLRGSTALSADYAPLLTSTGKSPITRKLVLVEGSAPPGGSLPYFGSEGRMFF